jgi:hypothetical protein
MRHRKCWSGVAAAALVAGVMPLLASSAYAATAGSPVVTFTGSVGTLPGGPGTIVIEAETARDVNGKGVPQELVDTPVATQAITSLGFSVPVPSSAALDQAEQQGNGHVNFDIIVTSGASQTSQYVSAPIPAGAGQGKAAPSSAAQAASQVHVPAFLAYRTVGAATASPSAVSSSPLAASTPATVPVCTWHAVGPSGQKPTTIGEVHVANVGGVTNHYEFSTRNDMTISTGLALVGDGGDGAGQFSYDGTTMLTNSLGAGGGGDFGQGTYQYVFDDVVYQRYQGLGGCPGFPTLNSFKLQAVGSEDDLLTYGVHPPTSPWGSCKNDPLSATLQPNRTWNYDHSQAKYYSNSADILGFEFGDSDGFTTDIQQNYASTQSAPTTYICGPKDGLDAPDSPILYNTN